MQDEIIVIGAGAAGLMLARKLSREGKQVRVLEGRDRIGGRILTTEEKGFNMHIEAGAEFIHGNLSETLRLLEEAGLTYHETSGVLYNAREADVHKQHDFVEHQKLFAKKLAEVKEEMSVAHFLDLYFRDEKYISLTQSINAYVQGYDLADPDHASTFSLREEWLSDDDVQYRVDKGYGAMMNYMKEDCERHGCTIELNTTVKEVEWKPGFVKLISTDARVFETPKLVITVPLGIWHSHMNDLAHIEFNPHLPGMIEAAKKLGYGEVIKFIIEFNEPIWERNEIVGRNKMKNLGFVFGDTPIPTWWTQAPGKVSTLTGWFGGRPVRKYKHLNHEGLLQLATDSLCQIFAIDHSVLLEKMTAWTIFNWATDPYSLGGYAYASLDRMKNIQILTRPVSDTIFISGEAMYKGIELGTVEAALRAALHTADQVLNSYHHHVVHNSN